MNVPTHYNTMSDSGILRDLYAWNYDGDALLEYVCQRWELLVDEVAELTQDLNAVRDEMTEAAYAAESKQGDMQEEIDSLQKELGIMERDATEWEAKADELQMEVERLSAQLNVCDPFGKMRE